MDPGLGKTVTGLSAFKILKHKGLVDCMLVIAPLRVIYTVWPKEIEKWEHLRGLSTALLHGKDKAKALREKADIYLINPEGLAWLFSQSDLPKWDILCVDESTKFKNSQTKRFKTLRRWIPKFRRRWIFTGTFAPNGFEDLFGQIYILDEGAALGRYITHYRQRYFQQGFDGYSWDVIPALIPRIIAAIEPLVLRFKATDWLELPELIYDDIMVDLPPAARKQYDELEEHFYTELGDLEVVALNAAAVGVKCRQLLNGAIYGDPLAHRPTKKEVHRAHDAKLDATRDLVEQLQGQPALLLYEFDHDRTRLQETFGAPAIGGGTSPRKSAELVAHFGAGTIPLLLAHPASAGHGIDGLQESCHHIICYGLSWDLELYMQALHRVLRQGNESKHVIVHRILVKDSLDEVVSRVLAKKEVTQESLMVAFGEHNERRS